MDVVTKLRQWMETPEGMGNLFMLVLLIVIFSTGLWYFGIPMISGWKGKYQMSKGTREAQRLARKKHEERVYLTPIIKQVIEDHFTTGLQEAIAADLISIEDARKVYAKYSAIGFWGLHPRKFDAGSTPLQRAELKERLKEVKAARDAARQKPESKKTSFDKLLGGIEFDFEEPVKA